jgi:hypothetical protein
MVAPPLTSEWPAAGRPSQTDTFKFSEAYPAYSIAAGTTSELDHLIPLELGGANDAANLWPEVGPLPNPKDHVENALHGAVCSGRVALGTARRAIARNWETALQRLGDQRGHGPRVAASWRRWWELPPDHAER